MHPFLTLQFLTDGSYDPDRAVFTAPNGQEKHFVASDHVENLAFKDLTPTTCSISPRGAASTSTTHGRPGSFHMMAALSEGGWIDDRGRQHGRGRRSDLPRGDGARRGGCGLAASEYAHPRMPRASGAAILAA